jgi:hypothetical protein
VETISTNKGRINEFEKLRDQHERRKVDTSAIAVRQTDIKIARNVNKF